MPYNSKIFLKIKIAGASEWIGNRCLGAMLLLCITIQDHRCSFVDYECVCICKCSLAFLKDYKVDSLKYSKSHAQTCRAGTTLTFATTEIRTSVWDYELKVCTRGRLVSRTRDNPAMK